MTDVKRGWMMWAGSARRNLCGRQLTVKNEQNILVVALLSLRE